MIIKDLSFHEICDLIRAEPSDEEVNHIINQMIPKVWFVRSERPVLVKQPRKRPDNSNRISISQKLYL